MATSGATISVADLSELIADGTVHGLAEVMSFPDVVAGRAEALAKIGVFRGRPVDGHAPGLSGKSLSAYAAAGVGSDHECVTVEEAKEKLARGLYVLIREATNARNLDALLPLITPANARRICFCTDDRQPQDLLEQGSVDYMVRRAIAFGVEPVTAFRMATLNTAEWFGLHDRGAIAPGRLADLIIFDDLREPRAKAVYISGQLTDRWSGFPGGGTSVPPSLRTTTKLKRNLPDTNVRALPGKRIRVIGVRTNQLITDALLVDPTLRDGFVVADPEHDILKMMVIERHHGTSRVGVGFVRGFGLKRGAIAGSVAHDHHNIVAIGCLDAPMWAAAINVANWGGGLCAVDGADHVLAALRLPVAGLMSDQPIERVRDEYKALLAAARELGSPLCDPFMAMSFMALEVIPSLKLTDQGLVDVEQFKIVDLFV
jgi:adenine deaminase